MTTTMTAAVTPFCSQRLSQHLVRLALLGMGLGLCSPALSCSFGPLDPIKVGDSMQDVLQVLHSGCGGTITLRRDCVGGCDDSEQVHGLRYQACSENSRYGTPKCVTIQRDKVIEVKEMP
jgi:hypothetical protein